MSLDLIVGLAVAAGLLALAIHAACHPRRDRQPGRDV